VLKTVATDGKGTDDLVAAIERHLAHLKSRGEWQRRQYARLMNELEALVQAALVERWRSALPEDLYEEVVAQLCERSISPYQALEQLVHD
jgi:LAO/AO transport system kinase